MNRKPYDSDLTDEQWNLIKAFMEKRHDKGWGRPRKVSTREVVDTVYFGQPP